jgi:hypothetical protein
MKTENLSILNNGFCIWNFKQKPCKRGNNSLTRISHQVRREKSVSDVDTAIRAEKHSQAYCQYVENVF